MRCKLTATLTFDFEPVDKLFLDEEAREITLDMLELMKRQLNGYALEYDVIGFETLEPKEENAG